MDLTHPHNITLYKNALLDEIIQFATPPVSTLRSQTPQTPQSGTWAWRKRRRATPAPARSHWRGGRRAREHCKSDGDSDLDLDRESLQSLSSWDDPEPIARAARSWATDGSDAASSLDCDSDAGSVVEVWRPLRIERQTPIAMVEREVGGDVQRDVGRWGEPPAPVGPPRRGGGAKDTYLDFKAPSAVQRRGISRAILPTRGTGHA